MLRRIIRNFGYLITNDIGRRLDRINSSQNALLRSAFDSSDDWFRKSKGGHAGKRCYLLGCGPSLNKVNLSRLEGTDVMGVNGAGLLEGLDVTYFVSVSNFFWKSHADEIKQLRCRRFLPHYLEQQLVSDSPTTWLNSIADEVYQDLGVLKPWQFSLEPDRYIFLGGTVIFVCLQILLYLGYEEVVVLGLDHDYGINPDEVPVGGTYVSSDKLSAHFRKDYYRSGERVHIDVHGMERAYRLAHTAFRTRGKQILNASPGTKLTTFPIVDFDKIT